MKFKSSLKQPQSGHLQPILSSNHSGQSSSFGVTMMGGFTSKNTQLALQEIQNWSSSVLSSSQNTTSRGKLPVNAPAQVFKAKQKANLNQTIGIGKFY